jgi:hypothetical protein
MSRGDDLEGEDIPDDALDFARTFLRITCPERLKLLLQIVEEIARSGGQIH